MDEDTFGLMVLDIKIPSTASESCGCTQFPPALGDVNRTAKSRRIDEGFNQHHRMPVAGLPVGAQARECQA